MSATLILIRHGQSQWNLENRFTGWVDVPLTAQGEEEAHQAAKVLKGQTPPFDVAFTSVLERAERTLEIVLTDLKQSPPIFKSEKLNERHYGDLQGKNKDELRRQYGEEQIHIWRRSYDVPPPNGESLKDCSARTLPYFQSKIIPELTKGKCVLVVAHGNSLRSIIMDLEQMTPEQILELNLDTGVPIVYTGDVKGGRLVIKNKKILK